MFVRPRGKIYLILFCILHAHAVQYIWSSYIWSLYFTWDHSVQLFFSQASHDSALQPLPEALNFWSTSNLQIQLMQFWFRFAQIIFSLFFPQLKPRPRCDGKCQSLFWGGHIFIHHPKGRLPVPSQVPQPTCSWKWVGVTLSFKVTNFSLQPSSMDNCDRAWPMGCLLDFSTPHKATCTVSLLFTHLSCR